MDLLPLLVLLILYFSSVPIAFALIASTIFYFTFGDSGSPPDLILQKFVKSASSFPLLAVPFFIMVGEVMNYSGISSRLMKMADALTGHLKGGLAQVNIVLSLLMGGISGSANADAAMQSKILVPEMVKRGYGKAFSTAITAASSAVSPVIPPGIVLIIYALQARTSVLKMFVAGYVPAILMVLSLMVVAGYIASKRGYKPLRNKMSSGKQIRKQFFDSIWALLMPFGIILGLRFAIFTPTEAGAFAVLYCVLVGLFVYKELKIKDFPIIIKNTLYSSSTIVLIIVAASVFGQYMSYERIPYFLTKAITEATNNPYVFLLLVNVLLLLLGMLLEGGALLIIVTPLLYPVANSMGIDLVHFGIIMVVNIMIGGITPPFGTMMFTTCSITKVSVFEFTKEVIPFIFALIFALLLMTYIPSIVMALPNLVL